MKKILATAMILAATMALAASESAAAPKAAAKPGAKAALKKGAAKKVAAPTKKKKVKLPLVFWGAPRVLDPAHAGAWSRKYAMRKGYLGRVIGRACKSHKAACGMLQDAAKALKAGYGKCGGFWPNLRMVLTSLAKGVSRGSAVKLAPDLAKPLGALKGACAAAATGGKKALKPLFQALKAASLALKQKKATGFAKNVRMAFVWLKKPSLWGKPGAAKAGAKK